MRHLPQRFGNLLLAISLLIGLAMSAAPARASASNAYVPGEVIVRVTPPPVGSVETLISTIARRFGLSIVDRLDTLPIFRLRAVESLLSPPVLSGLISAIPGVVYAEPNLIGETPEGRRRNSWSVGGDDDAYQAQWAPEVLRLAEAHSLTRGAGITVAVLDTGVDLDHPALAGRLAAGFDFVDLDADPSEEGQHDSACCIAYGHGTHVAGLVALAAPEASIVPLRILKPDGTGNAWVLAQAIRYAAGLPVGDILPLPRKADVINISYSVQQRSFLIDDLLELVSELPDSPVVVAAAGNSGPSTAKEYPAGEDLPGVLAVAASAEDDTLADFSTRGPWVDVAAPGVHILSSVPDNTYGTWSGTSMAAPLASGVAALVRARYPGLNPASVVERIVSRAAAIGGAVPRRVDAAAALDLPAPVAVP